MFRFNRWNLFKEYLSVLCRRTSEVTTGWWRYTTARTKSGRWTCSRCPAPGWQWWWLSVGTWSCVVHCTHEATSAYVELVVPCWPCSFYVELVVPCWPCSFYFELVAPCWPCSFCRRRSTSLVCCVILSSQVPARNSTRPSPTRPSTATAFYTTRRVSMLCQTVIAWIGTVWSGLSCCHSGALGLCR